MLKLGLIGKHISYSKSPDIFLFMKSYLDIDLTYDLIDIDESSIKILLNELKSGFYHGFNVTQPYKEIMLDYVDVVTPKAKQIQAINTIYIKDHKIIGDNTDYEGFLGLLKAHAIDMSSKKVFILGTGGAAKACFQVLQDLKAFPKYVTRDALKVNKDTITYDDLYKSSLDYIIQATPVGTYPYVEASILDKAYVKDKYVIDLVYRPKQTQILKDAKSGVNGVYMLIIQALKSLSFWMQKEINITDELLQKLKDVVLDE